MRFKWKFRTLILLMCCLFPLAVSAQSAQPADIFVNYFEVEESVDAQGNDALHMDLYFTVLDENGNVIPDASVNSAEILVDGDRYSAEVDKPTTPLYLTIALDTSGSMAEAADDMRQAAINAVDNAPDEAQISIVRFNEAIAVTSFSDDKLRTADSIRNLEIENKGTCLYDAAYKAVSAVNIASEDVPVARRAVIFFTDGRDEITSGAGDTCSTRTFDEVVELASRREQPVPIHTIGLGDVDPRLPEISQLTGGLSTTGGNSSELNNAFAQIMNGLLGQQLASVDMFPSEGQKSATIEVMMRDNVLLTESIVFTSPRDFDPPPEPLGVQQTNLTYDEVSDTFSFNAIMDGTIEQIGKLQLLVVSDDGTQIGAYEFDGFEPPWALSADGMVAGQDYTIEIYALDAAGALLTNERGEALLDIAEFEYSPLVEAAPPTPTPLPDPSITLNPIAIDEANQTMAINTLVVFPEQIAGYEVQVVNRDSGDLIETISADFGANPIVQLPLSMLGEGGYRIIVNAFNSDGAIIDSSQQDISYTPPAAPGFFARLRSGFAVNPLIPLGIVLLLLALIGFFMLRSLLEKRNTGTPFLQGSGVRSAAPERPPVAQTMNIERESLQRGLQQSGAYPSRANETVVDMPESMLPTNGPRLSITIEKSMGTQMLGRAIPIDVYPYSIGREGCDLSMSSEPHLSRRHAEISFDGREFFITDLGSRNGVYIYGKRINVHTPTLVPTETEIGLGRSVSFRLSRI